MISVFCILGADSISSAKIKKKNGGDKTIREISLQFILLLRVISDTLLQIQYSVQFYLNSFHYQCTE